MIDRPTPSTRESGAGVNEAMEHVLSRDEARMLGLFGWNLRCNLCGSYGANWVRRDECGKPARPTWGALALCPEHEREWNDEMLRHAEAKRRLQVINFEQDRDRPPVRYTDE